MADYRLKELHGGRRRNFLKLMGVAAAAVGLERTGLLNYLADEGGHGLAEAAGVGYGRSLVVPGPNGSQAWFTQLWPMPDLAAQQSASFPWLYMDAHGFTDPYKGTLWQGGDRPFFYGPDAPWFDHQQGQPLYPVTAMMAGNDETHTEFPKNSAVVSGKGLMAVAGALGADGSTAVVPVIGVDPIQYGSAPGAPDVVTVPSAGGMVDLFNSAASQHVLLHEQDRYLFDTYYKALVGLRTSAKRSSWAPELVTTRTAARLIGLNFAADLVPTAEDLLDYGIAEMLQSDLTAAQKVGLENFGRALVTTAKAFRLGLSKSAIIALSPGPTSEQTFTDPHVTFDSAATKTQGRNTTKYLGRVLDGFYRELAKYPDPESPGEKLDKTTTFVTFGDTPHTPIKAKAWPDATPDDSNWLWLMDPKGNVKNGWFGQVMMNKVGGKNAQGFDPQTGEESANITSTDTASAAGAAVTYAIAKGNMNKVSEFYSGGPLSALVNQKKG